MAREETPEVNSSLKLGELAHGFVFQPILGSLSNVLGSSAHSGLATVQGHASISIFNPKAATVYAHSSLPDSQVGVHTSPLPNSGSANIRIFLHLMQNTSTRFCASFLLIGINSCSRPNMSTSRGPK